MRLWGFLFCFLFVGCSTYHGMAEKFYSEGDYEAAARTYERILQRDQDDVLALENLRRARQGIIERDLIETRQLRLSNNHEESHRRLVKTISNERGWNLSPAGAAFSAQKEEMEYFFDWLLQQTRLEMKEKKYLKAKLRLEEYSPIFDGSDFSGSFARLQTDVDRGGSGHCSEIKSIVAGYFSKEFWKRYCMYWGENPTAKNYSLDKNLIGYSEVILKGTVLGMPTQLESNLSNAILEGLKGTPFYNPDGKPLTIQSSGTFETSYRETQTEGIHNYDEEEPYQTTDTVSYQVDVPYTDWVDEVNPVTHESKKVPITKTRSETRYRDETVTKYRTVARSLRYPKMDFAVDYKLFGALNLNVDGVAYVIPLNDQLHIADSFHEASNQRIGLYPKKKNYVTESDWLKDTFTNIDNDVRAQVNASWTAKYCKPVPNRTQAQQSEYILKCAVGSQTADVIDNWSREMFGLTFAKVKKSIGSI